MEDVREAEGVRHSIGEPLWSRQALGRFRTFPTAELALDALAGGAAAGRPTAPDPAAYRIATPIPQPRRAVDAHVDGPEPAAALSG